VLYVEVPVNHRMVLEASLNHSEISLVGRDVLYVISSHCFRVSRIDTTFVVCNVADYKHNVMMRATRNSTIERWQSSPSTYCV